MGINDIVKKLEYIFSGVFGILGMECCFFFLGLVIIERGNKLGGFKKIGSKIRIWFFEL